MRETDIDTPTDDVAAPPCNWSRQDRLLDEALQETFPASDPIAVMRLT